MCEFFYGVIAQLARASALHAEGRRFDSDWLHKRFLKSVGLECHPYKVKVVGSNPTGTTDH